MVAGRAGPGHSLNCSHSCQQSATRRSQLSVSNGGWWPVWHMLTTVALYPSRNDLLTQLWRCIGLECWLVRAPVRLCWVLQLCSRAADPPSSQKNANLFTPAQLFGILDNCSHWSFFYGTRAEHLSSLQCSQRNFQL